MQYLSFVDYLISLLPVSSSFIHSAANDKVSFIIKCWKASSVCVHPIFFFIYLPVDTGQFSWILCTIWQWICDCRYLLDILILSSLDINSKEWFLDLMISLLIIFWGTSKLFHNGYVILHSYQQVQNFQFATLLPKSFTFFLKYTTWKVVWRGFHFTNTYWCWGLFLCILITSLSSMKKYLLKPLHIFKSQLFAFCCFEAEL